MTTIAPPNPPMIPARWHGGTQTPKLIVMHGTVSPCVAGGARAVAKFFATEDNKTSAHYVRDPLETIQCVGDHTVAYHCGYNQDSIGYELCDPQAGPGARWSDKNHTMMLAGAAKDVARLCLAYGIPVAKVSVADLKAGKRGICGHADMSLAFRRSTHTDPGAAFPWSTFIGLVKSEVKKLQGGMVPPAEKPQPDTSRAKAREIVARIKHTLYSANQHAVDLDDLEALIKLGHQPEAKAAKALRDQIKSGASAFGAAVKW